MTEAVATGGLALKSVADKALKASAAFWLVMALIGQWAFFYYIAAFYGPSALTGNFQAWSRNTMLFKGYVPGDTAGNLAFGAHALLAGIIAFGGALQLVPQIRARAPAFHRWNGRLFLLTACSLSLAGFYLVWGRGSSPNLANAVAISGNGALILAFAALAWRYARARAFTIHRRWALRLYLVSNAQWFMRVGFFAWFMVSRPLAIKGLDGLFFIVWSFGCYLVPLAVLELYLHAKAGAGPRGRFAMAGGLLVLTLLMSVGMFGFTLFSQRILSGAPIGLPT